MDEFSLGVKVWWGGMCVLALVNTGLWIHAWQKLKSSLPSMSSQIQQYRRWQWIMSGVYVLGCASRSVVLRGDLRRFAMFDSPLASVMVGRSIATVAEICFVVQWVLFLRLISSRTGSRASGGLAWTLVPLIVIAECASWYGVLTTNYFGNAIEESIWAGTAALFMVGMALCRKHAAPYLRRWLGIGLLFGAAYVVFMVTIDVPTYVSRWRADEAAGKAYLSVTEGFTDIQRVVVTGRWEDWKYEMVWMSLYFSCAVWISLAMIFRPRFDEEDVSTA